jgi:hypothetical protein
MKTTRLISLVLIGLTTFLQATVLNIPTDYPTIQAGIDSASVGDTVLVQPGTYVENINFNGKNIVVGSLFLTTDDTAYISQTVIDGNQTGSVVTFATDEDSTAILCGFTVTDGNADFGGGIYCYRASPILRYLHVRANNALYEGGGISCIETSMTIENVSLLDNTADYWGAGIAIIDTTFKSASVELNGIVIRDNFSYGIAGAIGLGHVYVKINRGEICYNRANALCGGIDARNADLTLVNTAIYRNRDYSGGRAIYAGSNTLVLIHCTIADNDHEYDPDENDTPDIAANSCSLWVRNSIVFRGETDGIEIKADTRTSHIDVSHSIVKGTSGDGNLTIDPLFVNPADGDYRLSDNSPAISRPNPAGTNPDMGAYESPLGEPILESIDSRLPNLFKLHPAYPNPFNPATTIRYDLPHASEVSLIVYDLLGREVARLMDGYREPGYHQAQWDGHAKTGRSLPSGIYIARLTTPEYSKSIKMVLLK